MYVSSGMSQYTPGKLGFPFAKDIEPRPRVHVA
jgi:hypothetical protein